MIELIQRLFYFEFHGPVYISLFLLFAAFVLFLFLFPPASTQDTSKYPDSSENKKNKKKRKSPVSTECFLNPNPPFSSLARRGKVMVCEHYIGQLPHVP